MGVVELSIGFLNPLNDYDFLISITGFLASYGTAVLVL